MIESGLTTAWRNGTPEQKEAIVDSYYKKQLENAKAGEAVTHYTNMLAFFANGGVPIRHPAAQAPAANASNATALPPHPQRN